VVTYLGGLVHAGLPHLDEVRRKRPSGFPTLSVLAGTCWLVGTLVVLAAGVATADGWPRAAERARALTAPLLAGFAAQVLLGALSYLVPVVVGGGPTAVRAMVAVLDRAAPARVAAADAGLLLSVLPVPSLVRVLCSVVVLLSLASFLPLVVRVGRQGVDAGQHAAQQESMVVGEGPDERLLQPADLAAHRAAGQLRQHPRIPLTREQRVHHRPTADPEDVAGHDRQLDLGVFQQLLDPVLLPRAVGDQRDPVAGQVPQPPDRQRRHETGPDHLPLGDLAQPHRVQPVGLGPPG
jgi:hypothetical protein